MKLWMFSKCGFISLTVFIFTLYYLVVYFQISDPSEFGTHAGNRAKRILFWNKMYGDRTFRMGEGDIFHDCPVNNCYRTHDRNYMDLLDFDAILFHGMELNVWDLPVERSPKQWYVFVNLDNPVNRPLENHLYEDYFNITMTYRLDSDIVWTYGIIKDIVTDEIVAPLPNTSWNSYNRSGKSKPVIWFVSNCMAQSGRFEYATELSKHIGVDIYGRCGKYNCPHGEDCFDIVERDYSFYLSFENALCDDFVTDHLYNALRYNVVPIVYGGANYSLFAPPESHINALHFETPGDLAVYLKWLMRHPEEYRKYFEWKKYYKIDSGVRRAVCNLCKFLHEERQPRWYNEISKWYSVGRCPLHRFLDSAKYITRNILNNQD